jgi:hypothetical protein
MPVVLAVIPAVNGAAEGELVADTGVVGGVVACWAVDGATEVPVAGAVVGEASGVALGAVAEVAALAWSAASNASQRICRRETSSRR